MAVPEGTWRAGNAVPAHTPRE